MDINVPYMPSVKNLSKILDAIQKAAVPENFSYEFLKDLSFSSSNDRSIIKLLKYLGMLDSSGRPQSSYRDFADQNKTKLVLAQRLKVSYDDLYTSDKKAHGKSVDTLKGWFRTKTGKGDAVALKMATTFKAFASYADFTKELKAPITHVEAQKKEPAPEPSVPVEPTPGFGEGRLGLVYRLEIHLPDTQNIETFRAIFKALREELMT